MSTKPEFSELVRYIEGDVTQLRAAELEAHLATSPEARAELESVNRLVNALTLPDPELEGINLLPAVRAKLDRPAKPVARPTWRGWLGGGLALAASLTTLLVGAPLLRSHGSDDFRAKGNTDTPSQWAGIEIFRVGREHSPSRLDGRMMASDGLAFAYRNGGSSPFSHLAIFAVDSDGAIFWYYPAWEHPSENPQSVDIRPSLTPIELADAVHHSLAPGPLRLHALFTRVPVHAAEVEARVRAAGPTVNFGGPEAVDQAFSINVEPEP